MNIRTLFSQLFGGPVSKRQALAEAENSFLVGARAMGDSVRDRPAGSREDGLAEALEAWRHNPLARRIVGLTSQYVVGGGIRIECRHPATARFIESFWHNPLNRMPVRVYEWCDELTRSGDLFVLVSTDAAGMSYVRAIPAADIDAITSRPNDVEQAISFTSKADPVTLEVHTWPAYDAATENGEGGSAFEPVMLHYAINRPVGGQWGESDLAPLLKWLARYSSWLEDRARLNRFRNAFLYVVKAKFVSEAERLARQATLALHPPSPGSILVTDESEEWSVIAPELNSGDANADGLALKKMIAGGAGVPLHFLAEPESATRTTAEAAGGPTFRHFEQRQNYFLWLLADVLRVVIQRRARLDRRVSRNASINVLGGDISYRDNEALSVAAANSANVFTALYDRQLIDGSELLRLVYRFAGETLSQEQLERLEGQPRQPATIGAMPAGQAMHPKGAGEIDAETGEPK